MNSEDRATPWVEVALITLSASEKVIGHGNTAEQAHMYHPYRYSYCTFGPYKNGQKQF